MSNAKMVMAQAAAASTLPDSPWNLSYAYLDSTGTWDVSSAVLKGNFNLVNEESNPSGAFFKPDGTKLYVCGYSGDAVYEYDLSTAWDVTSATFLQFFSVSAQEGVPSGLFFKPDGTKMYVVGYINDNVNEYDLSTAWDISTASFVQNFSVAAQEATPQDVFFKPDGTKMYIVGTTGDSVHEYNLSTAWDVSTASFLQNKSGISNPLGLFFKPDGLKMYVLANTDFIYEYDLSTAWDVSTTTLIHSRRTVGEVGVPQSVFFKPDGTRMYVVGNTDDRIYQYLIGGFNVSAQETGPEGLFFKPDGTKMYITGIDGDDVNEYDLSTAWDVSTASFLQLFSVLANTAQPSGLFFKPDGLKMYVVGPVADAVIEYDLSTAWDVSSASFLQDFSVAAQEGTSTDLFFKPDGLKMYILGRSGDNVNEYNLSTAWDVSSASFLQLFSVAAQDTFPTGIFFKPDGTKMYVIGTTGDNVSEYALSTAWDISTASFLQSFSVAAQDTLPQGLFFKDDGSQMFVLGNATDSVHSYTLGVQP